MFSRVIHPVSRRSSIYFRQRIFRENSRQLSELLGRGHVRPWYRRVLPLTIVLSAGASSIPISLFIYRKYFPLDETNEENFDQNSESVSQNELDALLNQTQRLLDQEIYRTRSSAFFVPIRLFFRTIKLIFLFTPVAIFYFIQEKFAPQWFERWCFTLKRSERFSSHFSLRSIVSLHLELSNTLDRVSLNLVNGWRRVQISSPINSVRFSMIYIRMLQHIQPRKRFDC